MKRKVNVCERTRKKNTLLRGDNRKRRGSRNQQISIDIVFKVLKIKVRQEAKSRKFLQARSVIKNKNISKDALE